jgi:hypothetical protein
VTHPDQPHEFTPEQAVEWRVAVLPILQRLCNLQEEVAARHMGYDKANDCFCGLGGFWPLAEHFRSDQSIVGFIEEAVREKLDRLAGMVGSP